MFDLRNDGAGNQQLRPIGGPWSPSSRMRFLSGGQVLQDSDMYYRVHEIFGIVSVIESRQNHYGANFYCI